MENVLFIKNHTAYRPLPTGGQYKWILSNGMELSLPLDELFSETAVCGFSPRCDFIDYAATAEARQREGKSPPRYLVSACLSGERCRYDGGANEVPELKYLAELGDALPVCPECSGGLPCPRTPCERAGGHIFGRDGQDCTAAFFAGAEKACEALRHFPIRAAILKERSPSCGVHQIYDGAFSGRLIPGEGCFSKRLADEGILLYTEETLDKFRQHRRE